MRRTRLAPSPTGALHLGNALTFLITWALARQRGWQVVLRIDDLDSPRTKRGADRQAIEDLRWLGLDWDKGPTYQTGRVSAYEDALQRLASAGMIYPCSCTRREIEVAALSAPHAGEHELRYPGTCRPIDRQEIEFPGLRPSNQCWRIRVGSEAIRFEDQRFGSQVYSIAESVGDFLVATKSGAASYQLAVVIDDWTEGVNEVVRGADLLDSTARQIFLHEQLKIPSQPRYTHLPLVVGEDGRRLAKRHGDTRLSQYRERGFSADRLLQLFARWANIPGDGVSSAKEFAARFELERIPRRPIVFHSGERDWLERT